MRAVLVWVVLSVAALADAAADDHSPIEIGGYGGGFISNYYHQFYNFELFPGGEGEPNQREELRRLSPLFGVRFAYFMTRWLGVELELDTILTETKQSKGSAQIYGGRAQLLFQYPMTAVVPYLAIGDGISHVSSADTVLGSDTDWPVHVGAGVRWFFHRSVAIRLDARLLRAPSQQAPYTLNASLGEFMLGITYRPSRKPAEPPPPPPPPPKDSDGDGVLDNADNCPDQPEDRDLFDDNDGCPDPDNDGDGIADGHDTCPNEAEDKDGFQDDDGCVDADNDNDGVPDKQDKCPLEPEDKDGFQDLDGCAELDNDGDSFPDAKDNCPNEAEVINGVDDEDGCPDRGNALVVVSPDRLELLEPIEFKKTTIQKSSFGLLAQIGAQLRAHSEIVRLRITVHVQPTNKPVGDRELSELRAFAIREWLIKYGIDEKRLEPRGFGGSKPLVPPKQKGAKSINERLELIILDRK